ncbi:pyridoxamine 5'-phosphate oxidase family protein [Streptomyces carpaticus]|uniref:Pyridoxamine 5'-phosphate oxidase family protein n=1 Tax=Streptomyces cheonanensis TaxID=312720 RepID=A0ABN2VBJ4_9ACTN|nr:MULTISPECIES: MSMEG_1061 family FMN-dependent PPOX-type flavoprotein [Streptomyces]MCK1815976.1 pyridoxamine 5'-phosphate oxidase family protein [Streptomyces sp. XM4011]QKV68847.1 pyridoxamine 5'-phosphate oxidase family protein [Streptomyces harbinensis]UWM49506.1 pyridoxamine 5'-phosphate oxidase family protein [Streptomyces carpaticus]
MMYEHAVTSAGELSEIVGTPHPVVIDKVKKELGEFERKWLAKSPFCVLSTSAADGSCDVSPRGDPAGFALVLDDTTIAIPDRLGNRRVDSWRNVLSNPQVGLVFMIPGVNETLRINGRATLVRDGEFFDRMALKGRRPALALIVRTDEVFLHCSNALRRSGVWDPESWDEDTSELKVTY